MKLFKIFYITVLFYILFLVENAYSKNPNGKKRRRNNDNINPEIVVNDKGEGRKFSNIENVIRKEGTDNRKINISHTENEKRNEEKVRIPPVSNENKKENNERDKAKNLTKENTNKKVNNNGEKIKTSTNETSIKKESGEEPKSKVPPNEDSKDKNKKRNDNKEKTHPIPNSDKKKNNERDKAKALPVVNNKKGNSNKEEEVNTHQDVNKNNKYNNKDKNKVNNSPLENVNEKKSKNKKKINSRWNEENSTFTKNNINMTLIKKYFIDSMIFILNWFVKTVEYFKTFVEKQIDAANKKTLIIKILMVSFITWYVRRLYLKKKRPSKSNFDIYFMESGNYLKRYNKKSNSNIYEYSNNNIVYV